MAVACRTAPAPIQPVDPCPGQLWCPGLLCCPTGYPFLCNNKCNTAASDCGSSYATCISWSGSPSTPVLSSASFYTGSYATPTSVTYTGKSGSSTTVAAYPGQVLVFFASSTTESAASQTINAHNGTILAEIPTLGFYLVGVTPGTEASFIASVDAVAGVQDALPNQPGCEAQAVQLDSSWFTNRPVPLNLGPGAVIIDVGTGNHPQEVAGAETGSGGTVSVVLTNSDSQGNLPGSSVAQMVAYATASSQLFQPGQPIFINLSAAGGFLPGDTQGANTFNWNTQSAAVVAQRQQAWQSYLQGVLDTLISLPPDVQNNIVFTTAMGNGGTVLTNHLAALRSVNPTYATFLDQHTLIDQSDDALPQAYLTSNPSVALARPNGHYSNTAKDPSVIQVSGLLLDASGNILDFGTSFGAPRLAAVAQQVFAQVHGLTVPQLIQAMKQASQHVTGTVPTVQDFLTEAIAQAQALAPSAGTSGSGGSSSSLARSGTMTCTVTIDPITCGGTTTPSTTTSSSSAVNVPGGTSVAQFSQGVCASVTSSIPTGATQVTCNIQNLTASSFAAVLTWTTTSSGSGCNNVTEHETCNVVLQ